MSKRRHHPYLEHEGTVLWQQVDRAIAELEENDDLTITTSRPYVIGYICRALKGSDSSDRKDRVG